MLTANPYESPEVLAVTGPAIRPGGLALTWRAADHCRLGRGDRVLDVGSGTGATADCLSTRCGADVVGVDLSHRLLDEARRQFPAANLVRGDAMNLPFKTAHFNAVFCECVCSLLPDAASALGEFHRVLVEGGSLVVADLYWRTAAPTMAATPDRSGGCLAGAVDRQTMVERLAAAGFAISLWEDHSDRLKQLAARLVWAGVSLNDWWGIDGASGGCSVDRRPGYCLVVACRRQR